MKRKRNFKPSRIAKYIVGEFLKYSDDWDYLIALGLNDDQHDSVVSEIRKLGERIQKQSGYNRTIEMLEDSNING